VGFDLTTHNYAGRNDTTRPCRQVQIADNYRILRSKISRQITSLHFFRALGVEINAGECMYVLNKNGQKPPLKLNHDHSMCNKKQLTYYVEHSLNFKTFLHIL
jgi:arginine repressor